MTQFLGHYRGEGGAVGKANGSGISTASLRTIGSGISQLKRFGCFCCTLLLELTVLGLIAIQFFFKIVLHFAKFQIAGSLIERTFHVFVKLLAARFHDLVEIVELRADECCKCDAHRDGNAPNCSLLHTCKNNEF